MATDHSYVTRRIQFVLCVATFAAGVEVMAAENHAAAHAAAPHAAVPHAAAPAAHAPMGAHPGPGGAHEAFHPGAGGPHDAFHRGAGPHEAFHHEGPHEAFRHDGGRHYAFHEHDVHRFRHDDLARWRGGRWNHTCFDGRCGWWWYASGQWYFYDSPVYPYPLAVSEVAYGEPVAVAPVAVAPVAVAPAPMQVAPGPKPRYYCDNPRGYYPAVQNCNTQFRPAF